MKLFYLAVELEFRRPYALAAGCYLMRKANGWVIDRAGEIAETERLARMGADLGLTDAVALAWSGHALAHVVGDIRTGVALVDRALLLNANLAVAWQTKRVLRIYTGDCELAIEHLQRAMRPNPLDPLMTCCGHRKRGPGRVVLRRRKPARAARPSEMCKRPVDHALRAGWLVSRRPGRLQEFSRQHSILFLWEQRRRQAGGSLDISKAASRTPLIWTNPYQEPPQ